jgi:NAD(P)-dependent dehydrogenase (short-subunit alcohol dehydrogenase family)
VARPPMYREAQARLRGRFDKRVAVVTGAASGIGAATARRLAYEGALLVLLDLSDSVTETARELEVEGAAAVPFVADVADENAWQQVAAKTIDRFGHIDVLVSNAFTVEVAPAHMTTRESWDAQLAVNLTGALLGFQACLPGFRARTTPDGASVILVSSVHARVGLAGHPAYAASKGALESLGRQLAVEYGPEIRVNTVLPGPVRTKAWDRVSEEDRILSAKSTVARRLADPSEIAAAIAFLASTDASFVTGASLVVDGGWTVAKASS